MRAFFQQHSQTLTLRARHALQSLRSKRRPPADGSPHRPRSRGQSFVELALVLPVLLIMLLGLVEIVFFIGRYLDVLDLSREAARFASVRDPYSSQAMATTDCLDTDLHFYYHTACIFSPPTGSPECAGNPDFCGGLNSYAFYDPATDDIVVSVYTVDDHLVSDVWPQPDGDSGNGIESDGYWAYSNNDGVGTGTDNNFTKDCEGNVIQTDPYYNETRVEAITSTYSGTTEQKGFVAVEYYYCYEQTLAIPIFTAFVPNPMRIHAYTLMPIPNAAPTATPKP